MSQKQKINDDLKKALLAGNKDQATVLRGLKSTILNAEIAAGKRDNGLDEAETTALLQKEVKQRKESAELYQKGGEPDRAERELAEIKIIENYLPKQVSDEELAKLVDEAVKQSSEQTNKAMGQIIGKVKQQVGSGADGARIAAAVRERLNS